jgi:hypothetical protein
VRQRRLYHDLPLSEQVVSPGPRDAPAIETLLAREAARDPRLAFDFDTETEQFIVRCQLLSRLFPGSGSNVGSGSNSANDSDDSGPFSATSSPAPAISGKRPEERWPSFDEAWFIEHLPELVRNCRFSDTKSATCAPFEGALLPSGAKSRPPASRAL